MHNDAWEPARRRATPIPGFFAGMVLGMAIVTPVLAATSDSGSGFVAIAIVVAIVLFVAGLGLRVWRSARMSPGWRAFIERRKAEGRSTTWAEWEDDDEEDERSRRTRRPPP